MVKNRHLFMVQVIYIVNHVSMYGGNIMNTETTVNNTNQVNGKKKQILFGVTGVMMLIGAIAGGWWWWQNSIFVKTDDARVAGTISTVSSKLPGRIQELLVKEGESVKKGQIVARVDTSDFLAVQHQAAAALASSQAKLAELKAGSRVQEIQQAQAAADQAAANLDNAQKNWERINNLFHSGAVSAQQRDAAETALRVAQTALVAAQEKLSLTQAGNREESIAAAEAQVKQAQATLEAAKLNVINTTIVAPTDGVVAQKAINAGEMVSAGQPIVTITDLGDVWINARIEETKIGRIQIGQSVEFTVDGYPSRKFTGTVTEIGTATGSVFALIPNENASSNFTKVTQRIPIKISLPKDSDVVFRPGMSVIVKIRTK
jgi:membrane fusion protein (multidrug efflux system)